MKGFSIKSLVKSSIPLLLSALCFCILAAAGLVLLPEQASAQSLVRLFSTPAERAELERRRLRASRPDLLPDLPQAPVQVIELPITLDEEPEEIVYSLGGTVLRGDGSYTVWINNVALQRDSLPDNIELLSPFSQGQVRIRNPTTGASYDVKPGQVLNLTTGQLLESYQVLPPTPSSAGAAVEDNAQVPANVIDLSVDPAQLVQDAENLREPSQ